MWDISEKSIQVEERSNGSPEVGLTGVTYLHRNRSYSEASVAGQVSEGKGWG